MGKIHSTGLMLILLLVLALSNSCFAIARTDTSLLTENELGVTPMNRTGFIYNSYSVFVYHKGDSKDGVIRFTDTIHYFNTFNKTVSFTFSINQFHEDRTHTVPLPKDVDKESYIFYAIPKTVDWVILPDTLTVESIYKGNAVFNVEINEKEAYELAADGSGGLISLIAATPSVSQNIGGTMVTSVPAYKVFIVLLPGENTENTGINVSPSWILYGGIIGIVAIVVIVLVKKLEFVEVEEKHK